MTSRIEFFHKKINKKIKKEPEWIWIRNFFLCVSHSKAQNVDFNNRWMLSFSSILNETV